MNCWTSKIPLRTDHSIPIKGSQNLRTKGSRTICRYVRKDHVKRPRSYSWFLEQEVYGPEAQH